MIAAPQNICIPMKACNIAGISGNLLPS